MTTEITFRPGIEGIEAALTVAKQITATTPAVPTGVSLDTNYFDYATDTFDRPMGVLFYFHRSVENVQSFAEAFGLAVEDQPQGDESVYTYAQGVLDGVPFRAWTLRDVEASAVCDEVSSAVAA